MLKKHIRILSLSLHAETFLNEVHVDLMTQAHAVLERALVVRLSPLRFDVLLDTVDLGLVLNEFFLDIIQSVVDVALQNLIFLRVMLHRVVSHLLLQTWLVLLKLLLDLCKADFFFVEVNLKIICTCKFICHFIFHLGDLFSNLLHFLIDTTFESLDLFKVVLPLLKLHFQSCICRLSVFDLPLLECKFALLFPELSCRRKIVLSDHCLLHMFEECSNHRLMLADLTFIGSFFLLETLHELVYLTLFLIQNFVLLGFITFSTSAPACFFFLKVLLNFLNVALIGLNHLADITDILLKLLNLSIILLDSIEKTLTGFRKR